MVWAVGVCPTVSVWGSLGDTSPACVVDVVCGVFGFIIFAALCLWEPVGWGKLKYYAVIYHLLKFFPSLLESHHHSSLFFFGVLVHILGWPKSGLSSIY